MKCYNCGHESPDDFAFCPKCGAPQSYAPQSPAGSAQTQEQAQQVQSTAAFNTGSIGAQTQQSAGSAPSNMAEYVLATLRDGMFLAICILISVSALFSLLGKSVPVIMILFTVFLWLTYAKAQKGVASQSHLRCISGTVFAYYVINYVLAGLTALLGVLMLAVGGSGFVTDIMRYIFREAGIGYGSHMDGLFEYFIIISGVAFIIVAVVLAVINYFATRSIHRFVQSVYKSISDEKVSIEKVNAASIWMMVFGIFVGISALSSLIHMQPLAFVSSASASAAYIIGSVMIRKYYGG